ncbi:hemopexin repeat-containing protein [Streptomyces sp. NPDC046275]|uniref:hemopexin repeat-containing protein n=1 Tax=Streptomyces sp. NPDC046275 TaxID=3157201 RepID=UPI0033CC1172
MTALRTAVSWPNDKTYLFFDDDTYDRYDSVTGFREDSGLPLSKWPGLPRSPDAFAWWGAGKAYAFTGGEYLRYDEPGDKADPGYPRPLAGNWTGLFPSGVDAAVNWGNGKLYFFKGSQYVRYDITADRVDPGYPRPVAGNWTGVFPSGIDAVAYPGGRYAYFFGGGQYRRFDVDADAVDADGPLDASFRLAPTPPGAVTAARLLTLGQANQLMADLLRRGHLALKSPPFVDGPAGITSPKPNQRVVVSPPVLGGMRYTNEIAPAATVIDNLDQRMLIALYRLGRWINASKPDVAELLHLGIGHGNPAHPNDCHNQGRAIDLSGITGELDGTAFTRSVLKHWGRLPPGHQQPGVVRISPSVDPLAYGLFTTAFRFGTFECEGNAIGANNKWPMPDLAGGGFVVYPDHKDPGLASQHQDHIHMQVGVTSLP